MGDVKASDIADFLGTNLIGQDFLVYSVSSFSNPKDNSLVFIKKEFNSLNFKSLLVLCTQKDYKNSDKQSSLSYIFCKNPRLAFAKVTQKFFVKDKQPFIHETAVIANDAVIHPSVSIGAYCVIESGVTIDEGTVIKNHVFISENVKIGKFCYIKSGAVIGENGFGFDFEENKVPVRLPSLGNVKIDDYVEIGSLSTIARGTLDNTVIGSHTKIDDHVHIAHNCIIGKNCIITACAELSGSVTIGENCWIGPNSSIIQKVKIGSNVTVGIGSVVTSDVEANKKVMGLEGLELRNLLKIKKKIEYGK